ncbi:hypothetical protein GmRootV213_28370 [Variovorax sp. V213]
MVTVTVAFAASNFLATWRDSLSMEERIALLGPEPDYPRVYYSTEEAVWPVSAPEAPDQSGVLERQGFASVLAAGAAPGATWAQKLRAVDVLMRCRGFAHQRVLTTASFSDTLLPDAYRELEAGIRARAAQCDDLLRLRSEEVAATEAALIADLTKEGAPFSAPALHDADGVALPAADLDKAKAQMRGWLKDLGPHVLVSMRQTLRELAGMAVANGQNSRWTDAMAEDDYVQAFDTAVCRTTPGCNEDVHSFTDRCLLTGRCPGAGETGNEPNQNIAWLTEELTVAIRNHDWQRIGL